MFPTKDNPIIYEISGSADIQKVLERIDPIKLIQKISNFRKLNIRDMNDQQISEAIFDVLCWDGYFACYTNMKTYPAGTSFFRVKKLKKIYSNNNQSNTLKKKSNVHRLIIRLQQNEQDESR